MEPHQGTGKYIGHWVQILEEDGISAALPCSLTTLGTWTTFFPLGSVAKDKYLFWRKTSFSFKKKIFCFSHDPNMCLVTPCWTQLSCFAPSPPSLLAALFLGTEKAFFCLLQRIEPHGQTLGNLLRTVPLSFHQESRLILRWIYFPEVRRPHFTTDDLQGFFWSSEVFTHQSRMKQELRSHLSSLSGVWTKLGTLTRIVWSTEEFVSFDDSGSLQ